jgi:hypothetical protein
LNEPECDQYTSRWRETAGQGCQAEEAQAENEYSSTAEEIRERAGHQQER